jgi:hypothetical protein
MNQISIGLSFLFMYINQQIYIDLMKLVFKTLLEILYDQNNKLTNKINNRRAYIFFLLNYLL